MSLTIDQEKAVKVLSNFIVDDVCNVKEDSYYSLAGAAGTGKTFLLHHILATFKHLNFVIATPTHQAKAVVKSKVSTAKVATLASLFKLGADLNLDTLETTFANRISPEVFKLFDVCIVEEASMINSELIESLIDAAFTNKKKIIFVGDKYQLPSPSENYRNMTTNLAFSNKNRLVTLNKIVRQESDSIISLVILTVRRALSSMLFPEEYAEIDDDYRALIKRLNMPYNYHKDPMEYIKQIYGDSFMTFEEYKAYLAKGDAEDEDFWSKTKSLAFTNEQVAFINNGIRKMLKKDFIENNDIVKSYENTEVLTNGIEYKISSVVKGILTFTTYINNMSHEFKLTAYKCKFSNQAEINIIDHTDEKTVENMLAIKQSIKMWKPKDAKSKALRTSTATYFKNIGVLNTIKNEVDKIEPNLAFAYSFTVHKSQGTTIENVVVSYDDFKKCLDNTLKLRLLYVALSRASKSLKILV